MPATVVERANSPEPSLGQLLEKTLHHAKDLVQAEISLAKHEVSSEISSALGAVAWLIAGLMFLQAALTTLGVLLVFELGGGAIAASVVVLMTSLGLAMCLLAKRGLEKRKLPQTSAHLGLDAQQVMETVK